MKWFFGLKSKTFGIERKDLKICHVGPFFTEISSGCAFLRLLHVRIDFFRIFGDDLVSLVSFALAA